MPLTPSRRRRLDSLPNSRHGPSSPIDLTRDQRGVSLPEGEDFVIISDTLRPDFHRRPTPSSAAIRTLKQVMEDAEQDWAERRREGREEGRRASPSSSNGGRNGASPVIDLSREADDAEQQQQAFTPLMEIDADGRRARTPTPARNHFSRNNVDDSESDHELSDNDNFRRYRHRNGSRSRPSTPTSSSSSRGSSSTSSHRPGGSSPGSSGSPSPRPSDVSEYEDNDGKTVVPKLRIVFTPIDPTKGTQDEVDVQINFQRFVIMLVCKKLGIETQAMRKYLEDNQYFFVPWDFLWKKRNRCVYLSHRRKWNEAFIEDLMNRYPYMKTYPVPADEDGCQLCERCFGRAYYRTMVLSGCPYDQETLEFKTGGRWEEATLTVGSYCLDTFQKQHYGKHLLFVHYQEFYDCKFADFLRRYEERGGLGHFFWGDTDFVDIDHVVTRLVRNGGNMSFFTKVDEDIANLEAGINPHRVPFPDFTRIRL